MHAFTFTCEHNIHVFEYESHWPQGRVAGLHVCKKGMQHSLTVACTCVIDNSCLIAYAV